jgi:signal transduction histidine kinase
MTRPSIARRVALVQTAVTLVTLAVVVAVTSLALEAVLARRTDAALMETNRRAAWLLSQLKETPDPQVLAREIDEICPAGVSVEVRDEVGHLLVASERAGAVGKLAIGCEDRSRLRVCGVRSEQFWVTAGTDLSPDIADRRRVTLALALVAACASMLVVASSGAITRRALRPLSAFAARVAAIAPGTGQTVGSQSRFTELELLRSRFDELIERFDAALARERRLTAQASHELRTPLTLARAEIEALEGKGEEGGKRERALAAIDHLSELAETLLWFARSQAQIDPESAEVVNLADLARTQLALQTLPPDWHVVRDLPDEALVRGDERLLGRVIGNLIDNALKYGSKGEVAVSASRSESEVLLAVVNDGEPSVAVTERLFEPFYRDVEAVHRAPGFGLGLPFARAVARAHAGDLRFDAARPGKTAFVLVLPLVHWSDVERVAE